MTNYKRYNKTAIHTVNFSAYCAVYDNRVGFVHEVDIFYNGGSVYAKIQYYNRSWESWEFESVINKAIEKLPAALREEARTEFQAYADRESEKMEAKFKAFQAAFSGLTAEQKKTLSSVTVTDKAGFDAVCAATQVMSLLNK